MRTLPSRTPERRRRLRLWADLLFMAGPLALAGAVGAALWLGSILYLAAGFVFLAGFNLLWAFLNRPRPHSPANPFHPHPSHE